jgi:phosphohistidine phosphatase
MMHGLHLLRHAKSSWKDDVEDHERPLARRGREAAKRIGEHLPQAIGPLDLVLCSSARRTRETLDLALSGFAPPPQILVEDRLYLASCDRLLRRLERLDEAVGNVLVIGHNPGLQELAATLATPQSPGYSELAEGKFPTAALASFRVTTPWAALGAMRHELVLYLSPRSLGDGEA